MYPRLVQYDPAWLNGRKGLEVARVVRQLRSSHEWRDLDRAQLAEPQFAYRYLNTLRQQLEVRIARLLPRHAPMAWLYLLRELPDRLFGWDGSTKLTGHIVRGLAETLTSAAAERNPADDEFQTLDDRTFFTPAPDGVDSLVRLAALAVLHKEIQVRMRMAAKGVRFTTSDDFPPLPLPTSRQAMAIALYDKRIQRGTSAGLLHSAFVVADEASLWHDPDELDVLLVNRLYPAEELSDSEGRLARHNFAPGAQTLRPLAAFNQHPSTDPAWYGSYAPALAAMSRIALRLLQASPPAIDGVAAKGSIHFDAYSSLIKHMQGWHEDGVSVATRDVSCSRSSWYGS